MHIINQYSAVIALLLPIGLIGFAFAKRHNARLSRLVGGIGLLLLLVIGFNLGQPEANNTSVSETTQLISAPSGQPVLIELYSDY